MITLPALPVIPHPVLTAKGDKEAYDGDGNDDSSPGRKLGPLKVDN